mgnify:CR=1 FL=1
MARRAFKLPDIGEGVVEGEIVTWHVEVGSSVSEDDAIVDVMTDKSTVTIPSPYSGVIIALNGEVGDMVAVGSVLVEFDSDESDGGQQEEAPDQSEIEPEMKSFEDAPPSIPSPQSPRDPKPQPAKEVNERPPAQMSSAALRQCGLQGCQGQ